MHTVQVELAPPPATIYTSRPTVDADTAVISDTTERTHGLTERTHRLLEQHLSNCPQTIPDPSFSPVPSENFVGRHTLLNKLKDFISEFSQPPCRSCHGSSRGCGELMRWKFVPKRWLVGPPGIGKTQLALQFAEIKRASFSGMFFINAHQLTLQSEPIRARLEKTDQKKPWLLIVDDVRDQNIESSLPQRGGCILLTTQRQNCPPNPEITLEVPPLSEREVKRLLSKRGLPVSYFSFFRTESEKKLFKLFQTTLGGLPALIEPAISEMKNKGANFEQYTSKLDSEKIRSLFEEKSHFTESASKKTLLLIDELQQTSPSAYRFFCIATYLDPSCIPLQFLEEFDPQQASDLHPLRGSFLMRYKDETRSFSLSEFTQIVAQHKQCSEQVQMKSFSEALTLLFNFIDRSCPESLWKNRVNQVALHIERLLESPLWNGSNMDNQLIVPSLVLHLTLFIDKADFGFSQKDMTEIKDFLSQKLQFHGKCWWLIYHTFGRILETKLPKHCIGSLLGSLNLDSVFDAARVYHHKAFKIGNDKKEFDQHIDKWQEAYDRYQKRDDADGSLIG